MPALLELRRVGVNFKMIPQALVVVFCIILLFYVVHLVASDRLLLKYSLLWFFLALLLLVAAIFPEALFSLAFLSGFETPANFIFFLGLFCLMAIALSLSVIVSRQATRIKNLTQRLALLEFDQRCEFSDDNEELPPKS